MLDPIDYLKERLYEIEEIDCDDLEFLRYKQKYKSTIAFLTLHNFKTEYDNKLGVTHGDREWIRLHYKKGNKHFMANKFGVTPETIRNILNEKEN